MMITINLLPQEFRKRERTPIVVFLPMVLGLIAVMSAGSVASYVHFAWLSEVQNQRRALQADLDQKGPNLKFETALLVEEGEYKSRAQSISDIAASRIVVTRKMDELWSTITAGDQNSEYLVWLTELKSAPPKTTAVAAKQSGPKLGGEITLKGYTLADHDPLLDFNRFHAALKASPLFKSCAEITNPEGMIFEFSDDRSPKKGWKVDIGLTLLHPSELVKPPAKAAGPIAEKPGQKPKK